MLRKLTVAVFVAGLIVPFAAEAHEPSKHKGKATQGQVVSAAADRLELKTKAGVKTVLITEKTKFERGNKAASLADVRKGASISVIGTTLASGEIAASEVLIPGSQSHAAQEAKPGDQH